MIIRQNLGGSSGFHPLPLVAVSLARLLSVAGVSLLFITGVFRLL